MHNTAGVAIRQIVSSLYDRVDCLVEEEGVSGGTDFTETQLPTQASDAYLLFQVHVQLYNNFTKRKHTCTTVLMVQCLK